MVESFTISTINFSIHDSNKRFFDNYLKALGLNQARMLLKLRNNYYIVFIWIDNGKYITTIHKKFCPEKAIFKSNLLSINKKNHINI